MKQKIEGKKEGRMGRWMMDRWMDVQIDEQKNRQTDGWTVG